MAYDHMDTHYTYEHLYLLTEMDLNIHNAVANGVATGTIAVDTTAYFPVYWFINGRAAPDTMLEDGVPWLPHQPYGAMAMMHPGDKVLLRLIGGGRDLHPFHHHGNNSTIIARDGRLLASASGGGQTWRSRTSPSPSPPAARWTPSTPGPARSSAGTFTAPVRT